MHSTHMTSKSLPSHEIFIARITVELNGLDGGLAYPGLLRTLRLSDAFTTLENRYLGVLSIHFSEALEQLVLLGHALAASLERGSFLL